MKVSWTPGLLHYSRTLVDSQMASSQATNGDMSGYVLKLHGLGRLRGIVEKSVDGGSYLAFKGVPYAKPPLGKLRFAVGFTFYILCRSALLLKDLSPCITYVLLASMTS